MIEQTKSFVLRNICVDSKLYNILMNPILFMNLKYS